MAVVVGVSFKRAGKVYYFDPGELELELGTPVIVETARGMECGEVVTGRKEVGEEELVQPLKPVIRAATQQDLKTIEQNEKKELEAFDIATKRIAAHGLEMKLVGVEYTFDGSKIVFYFTANGRVDFRELVKDLASVFKTRIELRQIGVRDEAKMIGGLGACGRTICCRAFLGDFQPVSIKMAKEQNLLLNPTKISGLCGRLMCCLKYEQDGYEEVYKNVPRQGKEAMTPDGRGVVAQVKAIRGKLAVRISLPDRSTEVRDYDFADVSLAKPLTEEELAQQKAAAEEAERLAERQAELRAQRAAQKQQRLSNRPQREAPPKAKEYVEPKDQQEEPPKKEKRDQAPRERRPRPPRPPKEHRDGQGQQRNQGQEGAPSPQREGQGQRPPRQRGPRSRRPKQPREGQEGNGQNNREGQETRRAQQTQQPQ